LNSTNLSDVFVSRANQWPDRSAIISPRLNLSFRDLATRAARSAHELRALGMAPGSNVGIALRDSGEAISLMISLWMMGSVPVPIDFRTRAAERAVLTKEFDLVTIIEDRQAPESGGYAPILVDDGWTDSIAKHDGTPSSADVQSVPALISLTSGTTTRPLGVVLTHEQLLFRLETNIQLGRRRPGGFLLNPIPLSSSGSRNHALSKLFDGATVFFYPPVFAAGELSEAILSRKVTSLCVVPTILRGLLELHPGRSAPLFRHLDVLYCFGAPSLPEEKQRARSELCEHFVEGYSSSVSGRISALYGMDVDERPETVGRVLPYVELQIVDGSDQRLPVGREGIIRVRSPGMAIGTYGNTPRTDGDRIKDGWSYTGDIGVIDNDGFLRLVGRTSDVIIRGGTNVHPSEVEAALAKHEGVKEVVVVGFAKSREGEEVGAFIVPSGELSEAALVAHCRVHLSPDKRPRRFVFLKELPRNANGKIERTKLRQCLQFEN
jgi:long-chain acyl-CoA synthetase